MNEEPVAISDFAIHAEQFNGVVLKFSCLKLKSNEWSFNEDSSPLSLSYPTKL